MGSRAIRIYGFVTSRILDKLGSAVLLVLRLFVGWQFFQIGSGKLAHIERVVHFFGQLGIPMPLFSAYLVGTVETIGGILLLAGLGSRIAALPLAINMTIAYATADRDALLGVFRDPDTFIKADPFPFLLTSLLVLSFGPGLFSLDALIALRLRRRSTPHAELAREESAAALD
jgi:putative oxidoreductase